MAEIMIWALVFAIAVVCILIWKRKKLAEVWTSSRKVKGSKKNSPDPASPDPAQPTPKPPEVKWMNVKVWMKESTRTRFQWYLTYQSALQTIETGDLKESTPDEAINELIALYVQNVKMYGKFSTKKLNRTIKSARDEEAKGGK